MGAGPRVAVGTAAFHADTGFVPLFVPLSRGFEKNKNVFSPSTRIWRAVSSHSPHHPHEVILAQFSLYVHTGGLRDAPLDIWGRGGGLEFLLLANFFFTSGEKTLFFLAINLRQFFLCFVKEIKYLFFCRMLSLLCTLTLGGFSGQHIFHKFRQQTLFSAHIFNKLFFFTFVATIYLFQFFNKLSAPH